MAVIVDLSAWIGTSEDPRGAHEVSAK